MPIDLDGKRVALVMLSAIGDVVHALPIVNSLRAHAPRMHLTWIVQPGPHGLVANHPAVDEFILFDRKKGVRAFLDLWRETRGKHFDVVLDPHVYFKAGVITAMLDAPRKIGFDRARARDLNWLFTNEKIAPGPPRHVQDRLLEFVEHLGIPRRLEWRMDSTPDERARYADLLPPSDRPTAGLVLGTSKAEKDWPAERYAELVDRLEERGLRTVLVGGRSERELAAAEVVRQRAKHQPLDLLAWDLRRLVYLIERLDVLVSPDTGPTHMGVALGTPTVGLLGYTNPRYGGPYHRFHDLLVDAFADPGEELRPVAEYRPGRMERIAVDEVMEKVERALRVYPRGPRSGQAAP